jgi:uncharacterized LabA/DUF88 family protein
MKKRAIILIDGSNFYFKLKDLELHHIPFNFSSFAKLLAKEAKVVDAIYYVGAVKNDQTERGRKMFSNQQRLFAQLKKHKFHYSLGYLLKSAGRYHEKGVDVNIAVDMLVAAYENKCDKIILVSSDSDLIPAIKKAREKGKEIEYIGFSHQPSVAMVATCSSSRLLTKEDVKKFVTKS